jgi:hypothetical protein
MNTLPIYTLSLFTYNLSLQLKYNLALVNSTTVGKVRICYVEIQTKQYHKEN